MTSIYVPRCFFYYRHLSLINNTKKGKEIKLSIHIDKERKKREEHFQNHHRSISTKESRNVSYTHFPSKKSLAK
jgi:hypothetical protein